VTVGQPVVSLVQCFSARATFTRTHLEAMDTISFKVADVAFVFVEIKFANAPMFDKGATLEVRVRKQPAFVPAGNGITVVETLVKNESTASKVAVREPLRADTRGAAR